MSVNKYTLEVKGLPGMVNANDGLAYLRGLLCDEVTALSIIDIRIALNNLEGDARAVGETFVRAHLREQAEQAHATLNAVREVFPLLAPGSMLIFTVGELVTDDTFNDFVEELSANDWRAAPPPVLVLPEGITVQALPRSREVKVGRTNPITVPYSIGTADPPLRYSNAIHAHSRSNPGEARCGAPIPEAGTLTDRFPDIDCSACLATPPPSRDADLD